MGNYKRGEKSRPSVCVCLCPVGRQYGHWAETGFWEIGPPLSPSVYLTAAAEIGRHYGVREGLILADVATWPQLPD